MAAPQGIIRAQYGEHQMLFRVEGWAQMDLGLALRRAGEKGIAQGATTLLVDLRQCVYMDSTFLGTLLLLKRALARRPGGRLALIAPSPECCDLLEQMGLKDLFPLGTEEELAAGDWTALSTDLDDIKAFKCNVAQAHIELASLPGPAGETFKKVARLLEKDVEAKNLK
jgi:anti-anti-sigma factor